MSFLPYESLPDGCIQIKGWAFQTSVNPPLHGAPPSFGGNCREVGSSHGSGDTCLADWMTACPDDPHAVAIAELMTLSTGDPDG